MIIASIKSKLKSYARRVYLSWPKNVECSICHWRGRRFASDNWHPYTICPSCGSQVRHRLLLAAVLSEQLVVGRSLFKDATILHFAPEKVLSRLMSAEAKNYFTADFMRPDVQFQLDISDMPRIDNTSVDLLIACDVLEHVEDDKRAMQEIWRVLRPGGRAILTVPQKDGLESTYEDPTITSEFERLQAFGQEDHLRIYGNDFGALLETAGFVVKIYEANDFSPENVERNVLFPPVISTHPLATNHRKVYMAERPQ